jgi:glycogen debranching enzyme
MNNIDKAYKLATQILRGDYKEQGIYAGKHHFDDYWARDSFYACFAAIILKDHNIVKKNLLLFIKYQKSNGQIPLRVGDKNILLKFLGIKIKKEEKPRYKEDKNISFPFDSNLLFIITAALYVKYSKDEKFAKKYYYNFKNALNFILTKTDGTLLLEGYYSTWDDTLRTRGHVLYTSVCYFQALKSIAFLAKIAKDELCYKNYKNETLRVKKAINDGLWNGSYFSLMYFKGKRVDYFNTSSNLLAILFDLTTKEQALNILEKIKEYNINNDIPSKTNYPKYPKSFIYFPFYFIGMQNYHNEISWPWIGGLCSVSFSKMQMKKDAEEILEKLAEVALRDNNFYEVYNKGKPLKKLFYQSEYNFSWSAAFYIIAYNYLKKGKKLAF